MKKINIAIDGFSACGKSTLAKDLAREMAYLHIDSGAMYRALTFYFLESQINYNIPQEVKKRLEDVTIKFDLKDISKIYLNNEDVSGHIRTEKINAHVSEVAAMSVVRRKLVEIQQSYGREKGVVMDGRDIGTVVFPEAELKIFLTADIDIRTKRRLNEFILKNKNLSYQSVESNLVKRDKIDTLRSDSPLKKAPDAVIIDNSQITKQEQLAMILALAHCRCDFSS
jgi:cytidylate kinase